MLQVSPPTQMLHTTSRRTPIKSQHTRPPTHQTHAAKPDKRVKSSVGRYTYSPGAVARHTPSCVDCADNYITNITGRHNTTHHGTTRHRQGVRDGGNKKILVRRKHLRLTPRIVVGWVGWCDTPDQACRLVGGGSEHVSKSFRVFWMVVIRGTVWHNLGVSMVGI